MLAEHFEHLPVLADSSTGASGSREAEATSLASV